MIGRRDQKPDSLRPAKDAVGERSFNMTPTEGQMSESVATLLALERASIAIPEASEASAG